MPTPTYDLIASNVLSTATSSITFSSISGLYRDLIIAAQHSGDTDFSSFQIRFNSDSGANYSVVTMIGDGVNTPSSGSSTGDTFIQGIGASSTDAPSNLIQIMDYSATDKHKTVLLRTNRAGVQVSARAARWANTSAITAIEIYSGNAMKAGSTFYLYGIVS